MIINFITSLRPYGGKNLPSADFAFMSLDINGPCYNTIMANRNNKLNPNSTYEPKRCWVGETHKIIYGTLEEAELAAKVAEYDHATKTPLKPYKCPYANHYHLSST